MTAHPHRVVVATHVMGAQSTAEHPCADPEGCPQALAEGFLLQLGLPLPHPERHRTGCVYCAHRRVAAALAGLPEEDA